MKVAGVDVQRTLEECKDVQLELVERIKGSQVAIIVSSTANLHKWESTVERIKMGDC